MAGAIIQSPVYYDMAETIEDTSITDPALREKLFGQRDHVRKYGADYADRLRSSGLKVTADDWVKTLPQNVVYRYALPLSEVIYYCQK